MSTAKPRQVAAGAHDEVRSTVNRLTRLPLSEAQEFKVSAEAGYSFIVAHGFGRPVAGYIVAHADQPIAELYEDDTLGLDRNTFLGLTPSVAVTASRTINLTLLVW